MRRSGRPLGSGFRALFAGSLVSNTGDGIRLAAIPLLAVALTSSPIALSAVTAAQYLPWLSVAPWGGALVDRHDRRRTILVTQSWRGLVMLGLAVLVATDVVTVWHVGAVAFAITAGEILVDPAVIATVPTVVADDDLDTANGRIASAEIVTNDVAGGPLGSAVFVIAPWLPFLLDGASYLGSLVPFRRLPSRATPPGEPTVGRRSLRSEAGEGFRFLRHHPVLGPVTAATAVYFLGAATGFSLLVLLIVDTVGAPRWWFGVVLTCGAVGALSGTLTGSRLSSRLGVRTVLAVATAVEGLALAAMALPRSSALLAGIWFVNGMAVGARIPVARSLQQRLTPNHLLGRVNVSARMFTRGAIVLGALGGGAVATAIGVRPAFAAAGAVEVLGGLLMARALGDRRTSAINGARTGGG